MARPLRIQYPGAFYHVTCRGNDRESIFRDDNDRRQFLLLLLESLATYQVVLYAFVLMSNHFHLLVQTLRANLSEFMRRFNICYTGWFNHRYKRSGHLYEGRYRALLVDADRYLLELSRYVHLNPLKLRKAGRDDISKRWQYIGHYRWSSMLGYVDHRSAVDFIKYEIVLDMIGGRRQYRSFVQDGLTAPLNSVFKNVQYQTILGDDEFVARVKNDFVEAGSHREQSSYRSLFSTKVSAERILKTIREVFGVSESVFGRRDKSGIERGLAAEMLYKYSNLNLEAIGKLLGRIDYGAVYQLRKRFKARLRSDPELDSKKSQVERRIKDHVEC